MVGYYFKHRKFLDFNPHPFDIGKPFLWAKDMEDNHFLYVLYKLKAEQYADYYQYHLGYFLKNHTQDEKKFFELVWEIISDALVELQNKKPYTSSHPIDFRNKRRLRAFRKFLKTVDKWELSEDKDSVIARQQTQIATLQKQLQELNKLEVTQQIRVEEEDFATLMDLIVQLAELKLPSGRLFLRCDNTSPYYKMISKYFSKGGSPISKETSKNYFTDKGKSIPPKTKVPQDKKLYRILLVDDAKNKE